MHDLNNDKENLVGTHDAPIRYVKYCPEVNVMVTGSWDQRVKLWAPRTPCNAGTSSQVYNFSVSGGRLIMGTVGRRVLVGDLQNRLCAAAPGVQPEVSDSLHTSIYFQTSRVMY